MAEQKGIWKRINERAVKRAERRELTPAQKVEQAKKKKEKKQAMKDKKREQKIRNIIEGKKVEESSSSEGEEEEEESEDDAGPEKEVPLEKKNLKKEEVAPILKEVDPKNKLDETKDGLLDKVYEVEMGSEEDEGDNDQLYEDLQRIKQK